MTLSASEEARQDELDKVLDSEIVAATLPGELFGVVDALGSASALRRALIDPAASTEAKAALAHSVFDSRVSAQAAGLVAAAAQLRWNTGRALTDAIERQAVRAQFEVARSQGRLTDATDSLFRFARVVQGDRELREAISNPAMPIEARRALVDGLLDGKVDESVRALAARAVEARDRNFIVTIENYLTVAAELRDRAVARVTVARPLTDEQRARMKAALTALAGRDLDVQEIVDPEVIGGVRVELGDEVVDGSVASRLEDARRRMAN